MNRRHLWAGRGEAMFSFNASGEASAPAYFEQVFSPSSVARPRSVRLPCRLRWGCMNVRIGISPQSSRQEGDRLKLTLGGTENAPAATAHGIPPGESQRPVACGGGWMRSASKESLSVPSPLAATKSAVGPEVPRPGQANAGGLCPLCALDP